jgi:hypothetical protein
MGTDGKQQPQMLVTSLIHSFLSCGIKKSASCVVCVPQESAIVHLLVHFWSVARNEQLFMALTHKHTGIVNAASASSILIAVCLPLSHGVLEALWCVTAEILPHAHT